MKSRALSSSFLLCLVLAAGPGLATPQGDGWTLVVPGVMQRSQGGHKIETLAFGLEGFVWTEQQLQAQLEFLLEQHRLHPAADLEEILRNHRQQIRKIQQAIQHLRSKPPGTDAKTGCNVSYAAHANALAVVSAPGVRADASASLSNNCSAQGNTYAYAYAKADLNGTTTTLTQSDLDTGVNVSSIATASAAGTTNCESSAFASVTSVALGINYSVSDQSFACQSSVVPNKGRCLIGDAPAATLLLPYFEVDLGNTSGVNTLLSVNNASSHAVLAHVVVYSDLSVPVLDFNIYLTGYDTQTINLRNILGSGQVPQTAPPTQDTGEVEPDPFPTPGAISNQGEYSGDADYPGCAGLLPPPNLPPNFINHLHRSLTGQSSPILSNLCAGLNFGDNIARGYITIDTVNNCTLRLPSDPAYFTADITDENVLWGDYYYVDPRVNSAVGETLVHIQADPTNPGLSTPGSYTFYGRYVGWTAIDHRQPLATNFAVRYDNLSLTGSTDLIVWRDSKVSQGPFTCPAISGGRPSWYPLDQESIVSFDEEENPDILVPGFWPFPAEAQSTLVGGPDLPVPFNSGWMFLNLNTAMPANPNPPEDPSAAQAWVTAIKRSPGQFAAAGFAAGFDAIQLDSACKANHSILPP